jgi:hypothetical protein
MELAFIKENATEMDFVLFTKKQNQEWKLKPA